jgi:hypothetical protein
LEGLEAADRLASSGFGSSSPFGLAGSADVDTMVQLVMMQAAKGMDEDLRAMMAEIKAMTAAKARLRDLIRQVNRDVLANTGCGDGSQELDFSQGLGSERAYHRAPMSLPDPEADGGLRSRACDLHRGKISQVEQLHSILEDLKGRLDGMNEMSEMTSLRLQMTMDRRSKFISTLSNIMKKISTTQDALVQNLK